VDDVPGVATTAAVAAALEWCACPDRSLSSFALCVFLPMVTNSPMTAKKPKITSHRPEYPGLLFIFSVKRIETKEKGKEVWL
jgi:hypothetical protein